MKKSYKIISFFAILAIAASTTSYGQQLASGKAVVTKATAEKTSTLASSQKIGNVKPATLTIPAINANQPTNLQQVAPIVSNSSSSSKIKNAANSGRLASDNPPTKASIIPKPLEPEALPSQQQ